MLKSITAFTQRVSDLIFWVPKWERE